MCFSHATSAVLSYIIFQLFRVHNILTQILPFHDKVDYIKHENGFLLLPPLNLWSLYLSRKKHTSMKSELLPAASKLQSELRSPFTPRCLDLSPVVCFSHVRSILTTAPCKSHQVCRGHLAYFLLFISLFSKNQLVSHLKFWSPRSVFFFFFTAGSFLSDISLPCAASQMAAHTPSDYLWQQLTAG